MSFAYGDPDVIGNVIYGQASRATVQYLEGHLNNLQQFSSTLTDAGRSFFDRATQIYDQFNGADVLRQARAALRKVGSIFQRQYVRSIWEMGELQNAPLNMQRWIMAETTLRKIYHEQRCSGYEDSYVDMQPGKIGEEHYDYRRVMNGMFVDDPVPDENGDTGWKFTIYSDDLLEGDRELEMDEQVDIINTWDVIKYYVKQGDRDPTSVYDAKL